MEAAFWCSVSSSDPAKQSQSQSTLRRPKRLASGLKPWQQLQRNSRRRRNRQAGTARSSSRPRLLGRSCLSLRKTRKHWSLCIRRCAMLPITGMHALIPQSSHHRSFDAAAGACNLSLGSRALLTVVQNSSAVVAGTAEVQVALVNVIMALITIANFESTLSLTLGLHC